MSAVRVPGNDPLVKQLMKALGLPNHTSAFELRVAVDEIVTVKCWYAPEVNSETLETVMEEYELHRKDDSPQAR